LIETVILAFIVAKCKKYKLLPIFRQWCIYPIMICVSIYIYLEFIIWHEDYSLIKYSVYFKAVYLGFFIILSLKNNQIRTLVYGLPLVWLGYGLNIIAINANGGKMPVFPSLTIFTGYIKPNTFINTTTYGDFHVMGGYYTKMIPLCDIWDIGGFCIVSIGDILIRLFVFLVIYNSIKYINKRLEGDVALYPSHMKK